MWSASQREAACPCPSVSHDNQPRSDALTRVFRVDRGLLNMGNSVHLLEEHVGDDHTDVAFNPPYTSSFRNQWFA